MTSTSDSRLQLWLRKPLVRLLAAFAVILGPAAAVPLVMIGSASADSSGSTSTAATTCHDGPTSNVKIVSFDGPKGLASVELLTPGCETFTLVSYETPGLPVNGTAIYPQEVISEQTVQATSTTEAVALSVTQPECYSQVDLIAGEHVINPLETDSYTAEGTLLAHADFKQTPGCTNTTTPPPSTSTPPVCTTTSTVTVTDSSSSPVGSSTSSSPTPPDCTTTVTTTPPTTPTCSTTTTVTVTSSVSPTSSTSKSPTPPECTTTTTTTPPTTPTSPVTTSTTVLASSTSKQPTSSSTTPVFSTSVLPTSTSKAPTPPGTLPFTGSNAPVKSGVLTALGLISAGGALVLFAGRTRRRRAGHRVG